MSKLCVICFVIAFVFTLVTSECNFDVNTIQKLYDHATSFQNKYNLGVINSNPVSHFQEQYENSCNGELCHLQYRLLNETHLDDLRESYKIENNKLKAMNGQLLHGRDYKTTKKFTRYNFQRTGTGFRFENANFEDTENEETFDISNNDLSENLQISRNLSSKSYNLVNDLLTFHRKMINFLSSLSEEDKQVFYYRYNGDNGKILHVQFHESKNGYLGSISFELKSDGSISGRYSCIIQTQYFNIENGRVVLHGVVQYTGAYK